MLIYSTGAVTAVGMDATQTSAAVRARQSGIAAVLAQAPPDDDLPCGAIPARDELKRSVAGWLARLLRRALAECLRAYSGPSDRLALFVALPEPFRKHPITRNDGGRAFLARALKPMSLRPSPHSRVLLDGHASAAPALLQARELLRRGAIDAAVIGGVDSLLGTEDIDRLRIAGRLYLPGQPFGLIPGEAAAFLLLGDPGGPFDRAPMARVKGAGHGFEADHLGTDRYASGLGLKQAVDAALADASLHEGVIQYRVTDVNGERYRTWESTAMGMRLYRNWRDGLPNLHVPSLTGDVGAASMPLQMLLAAHALQRGHAPGAPLICEAASESGLRGACLLDAVDARRPPFHAQRSGAWSAELPDVGKVGTDGKRHGEFAVVARQVERLPHELAWLATHRERLATSRSTLARLGECDERIDAMLHLADACGARAWSALWQGLEDAGAGAWFAPTVLAIEAEHGLGDDVLSRLLASPRFVPELVTAVAWVSPERLSGLAPRLLSTGLPVARLLLAASMYGHRVTHAGMLRRLIEDDDANVRAWALRAAGAAGAVAEAPAVARCLDDPDPDVGFFAAWASTLLGHGDACLDRLESTALSASPHAPAASALYFGAARTGACRSSLRRLRDGTAPRRVISAVALCGDPQFVPWLVGLMDDPVLARAAGEAYTTITGVDLAVTKMTRPPLQRASVPSDSADDDAVAADDDDELPWPDPVAAAGWWNQHGARYVEGVRYFMGQPLGEAHCRAILKTGHQRQREIASMHASLLKPGTALFNTSAPAWRQSRWLTG